MSNKDDTGTQSDTIKRLEEELRDSRNRCEKLEKAMKYFIQATRDIQEAREEIRLLKAIMDMMKDKANDYTFETEYWGDCCNTFDEDQKHYVYGLYMGLDRAGYSFDVHGRSIVDIGGGPTSMLLKSKGLGRALVVDPLFYPAWTYARYDAKGINYSVMRGEDLTRDGFDECWIYNCLQHTDDPTKIIKNALRAARTLRIFEWVDIPAHEGHPQEITKKLLDDAIGKEGKLVHLAEAGCFGLAYFNTYTQ